jgi:hypothetical protein
MWFTVLTESMAGGGGGGRGGLGERAGNCCQQCYVLVRLSALEAVRLCGDAIMSRTHCAGHCRNAHRELKCSWGRKAPILWSARRYVWFYPRCSCGAPLFGPADVPATPKPHCATAGVVCRGVCYSDVLHYYCTCSTEGLRPILSICGSLCSVQDRESVARCILRDTL